MRPSVLAFWDIENIGISAKGGLGVEEQLQALLQYMWQWGDVKRVTVISKKPHPRGAALETVFGELYHPVIAGKVGAGKKNVADVMFVVEAMFQTMNLAVALPERQVVAVFITSDGDFAFALHKLQEVGTRNVAVKVICGNSPAETLRVTAGNGNCHYFKNVVKPSGTSKRKRPASTGSVTSRSSQPPRKLRRTNAGRTAAKAEATNEGQQKQVVWVLSSSEDEKVEDEDDDEDEDDLLVVFKPPRLWGDSPNHAMKEAGNSIGKPSCRPGGFEKTLDPPSPTPQGPSAFIPDLS